MSTPEKWANYGLSVAALVAYVTLRVLGHELGDVYAMLGAVAGIGLPQLRLTRKNA